MELSLDVKPITASVTTDASDNGLGFVIHFGTAKREDRGKEEQVERSLVTEDPSAHINKKELEAILRAMQENREKLRGRHVVWYSDSMTALAAVKKAVVITPLWKGATWWPELERMRVEYLPLGRLGREDLEGWQARNMHKSEWIASSVPLVTHCGPRRRERSIGASFSGSSDGKMNRGYPRGGKEKEEEKKPEA